MIFFPTTSHRKDNNCWLALNMIKKYNRYLNGSEVTFNNDKKISFNISLYTLDNQYYRATMLKSKLNDQKKLKN